MNNNIVKEEAIKGKKKNNFNVYKSYIYTRLEYID